METLSQPQLDAEGTLQRFNASALEWKAFLQSRAWKDLQAYMQGAIEEGKELLSLDVSERSIKESDESLRGGIKIARMFLQFPQEQLAELEEVMDMNLKETKEKE